MIGKLKHFDNDEFERSDPPARKLVIEYFKLRGVDFYDNPKICGVDLISEYGALMEVEHRWLWPGEVFPFATVHIPERKRKFLKLRNINYAVVNKTFDCLGICYYDDLKKHRKEVIEVSNRAIREGEYFFDIPVKYFEWINMKQKRAEANDLAKKWFGV